MARRRFKKPTDRRIDPVNVALVVAILIVAFVSGYIVITSRTDDSASTAEQHETQTPGATPAEPTNPAPGGTK